MTRVRLREAARLSCQRSDGCCAERHTAGLNHQEDLRADRLALRRPRCSRRKPVLLHALTRQRRASIPLARKSELGTYFVRPVG